MKSGRTMSGAEKQIQPLPDIKPILKFRMDMYDGKLTVTWIDTEF